mmetsp:Transcript_543/g.2155  ORF Transcript_543/g.2155 Transcript_543/m.2155 type:complete len:238 (-) Transcript_543:2015-2728(-)
MPPSRAEHGKRATARRSLVAVHCLAVKSALTVTTKAPLLDTSMSVMRAEWSWREASGRRVAEPEAEFASHTLMTWSQPAVKTSPALGPWPHLTADTAARCGCGPTAARLPGPRWPPRTSSPSSLPVHFSVSVLPPSVPEVTCHTLTAWSFPPLASMSPPLNAASQKARESVRPMWASTRASGRPTGVPVRAGPPGVGSTGLGLVRSHSMTVKSLAPEAIIVPLLCTASVSTRPECPS